MLTKIEDDSGEVSEKDFDNKIVVILSLAIHFEILKF